MTVDAIALLLTTAFRHTIREPNIEAAFQRFVLLVGGAVGYDAFCDAVAACLRAELIHEPIRLPEGALQCHWHLELTSKGVDDARVLLAKGPQEQMSQHSIPARRNSTGLPPLDQRSLDVLVEEAKRLAEAYKSCAGVLGTPISPNGARALDRINDAMEAIRKEIQDRTE